MTNPTVLRASIVPSICYYLPAVIALFPFVGCGAINESAQPVAIHKEAVISLIDWIDSFHETLKKVEVASNDQNDLRICMDKINQFESQFRTPLKNLPALNEQQNKEVQAFIRETGCNEKVAEFIATMERLAIARGQETGIQELLEAASKKISTTITEALNPRQNAG